jgi:hypothetical protein
MNQPSQGKLICSKAQRNQTNVFAMRAARSSATIPNFIVPIYSGQEIAGTRAFLSKKVYNNAEGPTRLRNAGHVLLRTLVTSFPDAESPQDAAGLNVLVEANRLEAGNLAKLHALRELAKMNHKELIVQATVPGHYNETASPFHVDQLYNITFDRGGIAGLDMYLFSVKYDLSEDTGQRTTLQFCKLGTICAQNKVKVT